VAYDTLVQIQCNALIDDIIWVSTANRLWCAFHEVKWTPQHELISLLSRRQQFSLFDIKELLREIVTANTTTIIPRLLHIVYEHQHVVPC
jgi:hypothetical protein